VIISYFHCTHAVQRVVSPAFRASGKTTRSSILTSGSVVTFQMHEHYQKRARLLSSFILRCTNFPFGFHEDVAEPPEQLIALSISCFQCAYLIRLYICCGSSHAYVESVASPFCLRMTVLCERPFCQISSQPYNMVYIDYRLNTSRFDIKPRRLRCLQVAFMLGSGVDKKAPQNFFSAEMYTIAERVREYFSCVRCSQSISLGTCMR